jgi:hypothetical protein
MELNTLPDENSKRFIAVLNKKIEIGKLMNALGHMTAGLAGMYPNSENMCFLEYRDKSNGVHPYISHFPFIVLAADNSSKIRSLRNELILRNIPYNDFTSTMTIGTSEEQVTNTSNTSESDLEYYGICTFAQTDLLRELTKKFSLFR